MSSNGNPFAIKFTQTLNKSINHQTYPTLRTTASMPNLVMQSPKNINTSHSTPCLPRLRPRPSESSELSSNKNLNSQQVLTDTQIALIRITPFDEMLSGGFTPLYHQQETIKLTLTPIVAQIV